MRLSRSPLLRSVAWGYTWVFRSVPLILQLLLWYNLAYLYPEISFGIPFGPAFTEVRHPVDRSTSSAPRCSVSGSRRRRTPPRSSAPASSASTRASTRPPPRSASRARRQQLRIVLPQAMRTIVPTSINEIIGLVKGTSVVYVLAYGELFYTVGVIYGRNLKVVPLLMVAAIWYLIITTVLTVGQYYLERHYAKGALRTLPPTPVQRLRWSVLAAVSTVTGRPLPASVPPSYAARSTLGAGHLFRTGGDR